MIGSEIEARILSTVVKGSRTDDSGHLDYLIIRSPIPKADKVCAAAVQLHMHARTQRLQREIAQVPRELRGWKYRLSEDLWKPTCGKINHIRRNVWRR